MTTKSEGLQFHPSTNWLPSSGMTNKVATMSRHAGNPAAPAKWASSLAAPKFAEILQVGHFHPSYPQFQSAKH